MKADSEPPPVKRKAFCISSLIISDMDKVLNGRIIIAQGNAPLALNLFQERINNYNIEITESSEFFAARGRIFRTAEYRISNIQPQKLRSRAYCKNKVLRPTRKMLHH